MAGRGQGADRRALESGPSPTEDSGKMSGIVWFRPTPIVVLVHLRFGLDDKVDDLPEVADTGMSKGVGSTEFRAEQRALRSHGSSVDGRGGRQWAVADGAEPAAEGDMVVVFGALTPCS